MPILIPAESTDDRRMLLRDPVKHWRQGHSAKSLADHWQDENGFPADVRQLFKSASVPGVRDAEMLLGWLTSPIKEDSRAAEEATCQ